MKRVFLLAVAMAAAVTVGMAFASGAVAGGSSVVYDATVSPLPGNLPSEAFQATQTG
jgi:hypothetical protein